MAPGWQELFHEGRLGRCGHVFGVFVLLTCVDGSRLARAFSRRQAWSVRTCVRTFRAVHMCGRLPVGKSFFTKAGLVGAAMCSAFSCGSHVWTAPGWQELFHEGRLGGRDNVVGGLVRFTCVDGSRLARAFS